MTHQPVAMVPFHSSRWPHPVHEVIRPLEAAGFQVNLEECSRPDRYALALQKWWAYPDPWLLVEHDIVATPELLQGIMACPEPICVAQYWHRNMILAQGSVHRLGTAANYQIMPKDGLWADLVGFGMVRFDVELRERLPWRKWLREPGSWHGLDHQFSVELCRLHQRVHVHYPVAEHRTGDLLAGWL